MKIICKPLDPLNIDEVLEEHAEPGEIDHLLGLPGIEVAMTIGSHRLTHFLLERFIHMSLIHEIIGRCLEIFQLFSSESKLEYG